MSEHALLQVRDLTVTYPARGRGDGFTAVRDVSFDVPSNTTVGLVGESGSGKSTIGRAILGMSPISVGSVTFGGRELAAITSRDRRALSSELQVIFQDPYGSLNPTRTIGQTIAESLRHVADLSASERADRIEEALDQVGMPRSAAARYPGNFSGGQRQRIAIARAIIGRPRLIICDEPTSALDLSVQAQVLNLLMDLQEELGLSYLFVSHDLAVVRHVSDEILVLLRGSIVERGQSARVYDNPEHPYTRALLDAAPVPDPARQRLRRLARSAAAATT
ncbi:ATP-binding cassette domain-containing protein [Herbiconiux ginsengi]|uniref:Peptide/nickel transport system ATP-binding protein n=1 Tax=Herbiconiux ginsengi TaxID=381665 RepID=A0A1H3TDL7_9MICO|nr:ATP-binding cassette domain-containing protein [Herbiconiux ginsengi]SDZ48190.1 peptide/nickel transport system ATP-binding protein [Herbiconiux ginsengi]